jgi:exopolysaccharide biosynthesis polyprenyl glycosylphosphotransferase
MIVAGFLAGYYLRFDLALLPYEEYHTLNSYIGTMLLHVLITPVAIGANGLYKPTRSVSWLDQVYGIVIAVSVGLAGATVLGVFLWRDAPFSRLMAAVVWLLTIAVVLAGRAIIRTFWAALRMAGVDESRVIVVGTGETARAVVERIRHSPRMGYRTIGIIVEEPGVPGIDDLPVLGAIEDIGAAVRLHRADDVIVAIPSNASHLMVDIVTQCSGEQVNIRIFPDLFQLMSSGVNMSDLNGLPLISVKDIALKGWNLALKRGLDLVVSLSMMVVLSPLFLLIAILIKLESPKGGVFYCQERVGLDGKPFLTIKFRTMHPDAEAHTGPIWAVEDDPRRTSVGALLRRSSLDELPQLMNVLIGEMSMVGPRPERPYFVEQFQRTVPRYFERHREKAGLTGWAQVNGLRGNTSIEERTAYDVWYVENWTLWLDIKILLKTAGVVIKGDENAY